MESMGLLTYHLRRQYDSDICDRAAREGKTMSREKPNFFEVWSGIIAATPVPQPELHPLQCMMVVSEIDERTPKDREIMVYRGQETAVVKWSEVYDDWQITGSCGGWCLSDPTHWSEVPRLPNG